MGDLIKHPNYLEPAKQPQSSTGVLTPLLYRDTCAYCGCGDIVPVPAAPVGDDGVLRLKIWAPPPGFSAPFTYMSCRMCRSTWLQEALWAYEERRGGFWRRVARLFGFG